MDVRVFNFENPVGFRLVFTFKPNEYFIDTELTKDYFLKCEPDEEDNALIFEGMLILLYCTNTSTTTTLYNFRS